MKKAFILGLALVFTTSLIPTVTFAAISNQNSQVTIQSTEKVDYAQAIIGQDLNQLIEKVDDYKIQNPKATKNQMTNFLKKQILSGSEQLKSSTLSAASDYIPGGVSLGPTEQEVFNSDIYCGFMALISGQIAKDETSTHWSNNCGYHNYNADAFRHSLWNALMAKNCGKSYAESFANAHETDYPNKAPESTMDYYNNSVGRNLGVAKPYNTSVGVDTQGIIRDVFAAVKSGKTKRFVGADIGTLSYLVSTNSNGALK